MLKNAVVTSLEEYASKTPVSSAKKEKAPNVYQFQELLKEATTPLTLSINPEVDLAALQYTGGKTGTAKGAMLTHLNLVSNAVAFATWINVSAGDTFLVDLPLFHIYGMTTSMNAPVSLASKIVLLPRFEPRTVLESI